MSSPVPARPASQPPQSSQPIFRSGAVARLAGMPVATLRIWEQRYQAIRPTTVASGHRLYSSADVERVTLLRQLTEQGHAIRLLAKLDTESLSELVRTSSAPASNSATDAHPAQPALSAVVVGRPLASRLQRWIDHQPQEVSLQLVAVFDSLTDARSAAQQASERGVDLPGVDLMLWQAASLQPGAQIELHAAQSEWRARTAAAVYRFSSAAGREDLSKAGAEVFHEPPDDESLGQWLISLAPAATLPGRAISPPELAHHGVANIADQDISAPRFADLGLTEFAAIASEVACECPSHLAQLLLQISSFENYSGECANKNAADAQLHAYLQRIAGAARMLFETALEQVAITEGLPLPRATEAPSDTTFTKADGRQLKPTPLSR
jgi:DNA-binding transcriptional MerR regulator